MYNYCQNNPVLIPFDATSVSLEQSLNVDYQLPSNKACFITHLFVTGTKSNLLETRASDDSRNGLKEWSIKSVHNWGENPRGTWVIEVAANVSSYITSNYIRHL